MSDYRRLRIAGFFTVNLHDRRQRLLIDHIDLLRAAVRTVKRQSPFHIDAWVVLPDHLHCLWTLPPGDDDFSSRWRAIKTLFSKSLPRGEWRSGHQRQRGERGIWQRRFWEHAIRSDEDFAAHADYIHANPVKHGWVEQVSDWPYSTFHRFVALGTVSPDSHSSIDLKVGEPRNDR